MNNEILNVTIFCHTDHATAYINYRDGRTVVHRSSHDHPHRLHKEIIEFMQNAQYTVDYANSVTIINYGMEFSLETREFMKGVFK